MIAKKVRTIGLTLFLTLSIMGLNAQDKGNVKETKFAMNSYIPLQNMVLNNLVETDSLRSPNRAKPFNFKALSPFCKMEYYVQKQSNMPIKFRLGSVDYVDKLESK